VADDEDPLPVPVRRQVGEEPADARDRLPPALPASSPRPDTARPDVSVVADWLESASRYIVLVDVSTGADRPEREGESAMADFEEQLRGFWSKLTAWLHGGQRADATQKAKAALQDMRTSETGRKAEAALRDLREGEVGRKAEAAMRDLREGETGRKAKAALHDLRESEVVGKARETARDALRDLRTGDAGRKAKAARHDLHDGSGTSDKS
jgi:hypothetical protein